MKRNKISILIVFIVVIVILAVVVLINKHQLIDKHQLVEDSDSYGAGYGGGCHMNVTEGKVIRIEENNTLLLEIVAERGGYSVGDKIRVKYHRYEKRIDSPGGGRKTVTPQINDIVAIQFWEPEEKGEDGIDLIIVDSATIYD